MPPFVKNRRLDPQPPPHDSDSPIAWELVFAEFDVFAATRLSSSQPGLTLLRRDMVDRHAQGIEKYQKPLRVDDGRDAMYDAYQEVLDAIVYLMKAHTLGQKGARKAYDHLVWVAYEMRLELLERDGE